MVFKPENPRYFLTYLIITAYLNQIENKTESKQHQIIKTIDNAYITKLYIRVRKPLQMAKVYLEGFEQST